MPSVFQGLQDVDQRRIKCLKTNMRQATEMERGVYPIINKCLEGIMLASDEIDEDAVSKLNIPTVFKLLSCEPSLNATSLCH
jgi:hypothetical protein